MQEDHAEAMASTRPSVSLKELCVKAASQHVSELNLTSLLELPKSLIMEMLPHLKIHDLNKLQPALNGRGISTYSAWMAILQEIKGAQCVVNLRTEASVRQEAIDTVFQAVLYGHTALRRHDASGRDQLLVALAPCVRRIFLRCSRSQLRQLLPLLEGSVRCVHVQYMDRVRMWDLPVLYALHRLLDHGGAGELVLQGQGSELLTWVRGPRGGGAESDGGDEDEEEEGPSCKRARLEHTSLRNDTDPERLCRAFTPQSSSCSPNEPQRCPRGQIHALHIRQCESRTFSTLLQLLPAWGCLRSLTMHSVVIFCDSEVSSLARSLKRLSHASSCSLADLRIGLLPRMVSMETLLEAYPSLRSLNVEIHPADDEVPCTEASASRLPSELPLETLSVKLPQVPIHLDSITSVLRRSPNLTSLCITGIRLASVSSYCKLFTSLTESNCCLRRLHLEDLNLAGCLPGIRSLLSNCMLEELTLRDCRLLERSVNAQDCLQQLVGCLKAVPSLRSVCLAHNRLAKNVPVLAELLGGSSPSQLINLDISSNFIQPGELLALGQRWEANPPPHRVTLDLRKNPWDRDQELWLRALALLRPHCDLVMDTWRSSLTMADHISNM